MVHGSAPIGFVLVTYKNPEQLLRLVLALNRLYHDPPIAIHHDFGQCDPLAHRFPANVAFVRPHVATGWGTFGVAEGTVRALEILYGQADVQANAARPTADPASGPAWVTLLSGCDYPLQPAAVVLADLERGGYDAHIDHTRIRADAPSGSWQRLCVDRYLRTQLQVPWPERPGGLRRWRWRRRPLHLRQPLLAAPFLPWTSRFHCYAGSQWFSASRRAARMIIRRHRDPDDRLSQGLRRFYQHVQVVDESYFHTLLANSPGLRLNPQTWRYIDWGSHNQPHPNTLTAADLPAALASGCHFARKFCATSEPAALDQLDRHLFATA